MITVKYFDCEVPESPYSVQVWDSSQVRVANVKECGECGVDAFFNSELTSLIVLLGCSTCSECKDVACCY